MPRKRFIVPGLLVAAALALLAYGLAHPTVTVRLTRAQVQERVDAKLPLAGKRYGVAYEVSRVAVDLRPDGRIGFDADVAAQVVGRTADVTLAGNGLIAYDDGAFYLTGLKVDRASPRTVDPSLAEEERPKGRIGAAIEALALRDRAARALEAAGVEDGAAFLTAKREQVVAMVREKGASLVAAGLDRQPVYRLRQDDMRQSLAKLALRDVRVEDGTLAIDLNVMHAVTRVLVYVLAAAFALVGAVAFLAALGGGGGLGLAAGLGALSLLD